MGPVRRNTAILPILSSAWSFEFSLRLRYCQVKECSDPSTGLFYPSLQPGPLVKLCCIFPISTVSRSGHYLHSGIRGIFDSVSNIHNKYPHGKG